MSTKRKPTPAPVREPGESHRIISALGLREVSYLNIAVDGWWVPRDIIGTDGKTLIIYRLSSDGEYSINGWETWHDGMFGGRYESIYSALAWVAKAKEVRAGVATDFRGV